MQKPVCYDLAEVIAFLKEGNFSFFDFGSEGEEAYAMIDTKEAGVLRIYNVSDNVIPPKTVRQVLDVLEHLYACIRKAHGWLIHLNSDENKQIAWYLKWFPQEMDKIYDGLWRIQFGKIRWGHDPNPVTDGFTISFMNDAGWWAWVYDVKFVYGNMLPIAVERWIKVF